MWRRTQHPALLQTRQGACYDVADAQALPGHNLIQCWPAHPWICRFAINHELEVLDLTTPPNNVHHLLTAAAAAATVQKQHTAPSQQQQQR